MATFARPEFVVFYAWQSDRPGNHTRYLIQEAATDAALRINADNTSPYNVRIDQDAQGVLGLCDIPATILEKIDAADGFLCDLTYIATTQVPPDDEDGIKPRYCSNPNVLFELGYAFRTMGYQRLICVMNEHCGPVAEQIFDLAHRRFPFAYRLPEEGKTRSVVLRELSARLEAAIRDMFSIGRRADFAANDRVPQIRADFEAHVRQSAFHDLIRRKGAIALSVIPAAGTRIETRMLREQNIQPLSLNGWNREVRGKSILSGADVEQGRVAITELRNDGVILAADTWILDPAFHRTKDLIIPTAALESAIITRTVSYFKALQSIGALFPWNVCVSLLEIKDYWLLMSDSEASPRAFSGTDIIADPILVRASSEIDSSAAIATLLKPAIDYIWRECGVDGSYNYTESGMYNARLWP